MQKVSALPRQLLSGPFRVARARTAGVGAGRLRGPDFETPFRGVRRVRRAPPPLHADDPRAHPRVDSGIGPGIDRTYRRGGSIRAADAARRAEQERQERFLADCRAFALLLRPGEVFCGVTAARLWDAPVAAPFRERVLQVGVRRPGRARRASGIAGRTIAPDADISQRRYGLPVSDAASTWLALAAVLPLHELVAVGDHLLHRPAIVDSADPYRPYVSLEELRARTHRFAGPGAATARAAVELVVTGAESRPESLLRLLLRESRLPVPEVNPVIADDRGRIGRFDLVFRPWKVIVEYDGDQHRTDDEQYERDMTRVERATLAGWSVVRVRKRGLFRDPRDTVRRVETALRRAGWCRPRPRLRASNRFDRAHSAAAGRDGST